MIDETKATKEAARGLRAETLLRDELLVEAFAGLESAYIDKWRSSEIMDAAGREKLFIAINVIGKVKQHLEIVAANGKVAAKDLADLAAEPERKRRFGII